MKEQLNNLFQQQMTRKQFLQQVSAAAFVVLGAGVLINSFESAKKFSNGPTGKTALGYGRSIYSGARHHG